MENDYVLREIMRLREQMHHLYIRDNSISEAVLNTSTLLDKYIYTYLKATNDACI